MNQIQKYKELEVYFKNVDHVDVKTIEGDTSLRSFISGMLSYYPWWILVLYRIREFVVKLLGLVKHEKPEVLPAIMPENLPFEPGKNASFFIVRKAQENTYWVSETPPDKHLTAIFGVVTENLSNGLTKFHVFTSVTYIHWTGPVYFNLIRPFHHLVVSRMMKAGVTQ
ncbi:MAG: DUF2867 domain-containing protein [Deltaproteobacteria bacterium]|nr:DUF2867 domain-containing protein [Deltaproteobacteria bacterium]MBT4087434.1 DUF2867 domain-containing protein [Deltaproteobacteria bacterium]MBT4267385.1 DUF2867 domain-containing protein [Deltaproteobacteria bacterium]MBT6612794.1 DUF2867 domain-containing protein [Deltaproteobacteria bacterium]MBT7155148.1 DUF2867 domain-containing protein [Deltaproteobacteria bacterium]